MELGALQEANRAFRAELRRDLLDMEDFTKQVKTFANRVQVLSLLGIDRFVLLEEMRTLELLAFDILEIIYHKNQGFWLGIKNDDTLIQSITVQEADAEVWNLRDIIKNNFVDAPAQPHADGNQNPPVAN